MRIVNLSQENILQEHLTLEEPTRVQGGAYFTKITYNNGVLFIQTPLIDNKNGVIESSKSNYIDLLFDINKKGAIVKKEQENFIKNFEELENILKNKIKKNASKWFDNNMSDDDIDYFYNYTLKNGKNNKLLRSHLNKHDNILIFDKDENINSLGDIKGNKIISIIEIKGIQITTTSLILKTVVKQVMIFKEENNFSKCLISRVEDYKDVTEDDELKNKSEETGETGETEEILKINDTGIKCENENEIKEKCNQTAGNIEVEQELSNNDVDIERNNIRQDILYINNTCKTGINKDALEEIIPEIQEEENPVVLKKPNEVYYELYKEARNKAKKAKKNFIIAYLEAKNIKNTYLIDDLDDNTDISDMSDIDNMSILDSDNELD